MKKLRKSLGLFAAAFAMCMVFALGAKVNAADVEMQIGSADGQVQTMAVPEFAVSYISSDKSSASFSIQYAYNGQVTRIGVFDANDQLVAYDDAFSYATVTGLKKNQVYYYRAQTLSDLNGTPTSAWSEPKAFTTAMNNKFKFKGVKNQKACTIKVPKINGVKNYTIYMSKKSTGGFKKVKNLKPGKKLKMTKFKKKAFKIGKTYYLRIQVNTKKNITCGNYYQGSVYLYRTLRF